VIWTTTAEEAENILGERVFNTCVQGVIEMRNHVLDCEESISKMHSKLLKLGKELFPGQEFVKWQE